MMFKILIGALLLPLLASGAVFEITDNGLISVDGLRFYIAHRDTQGKYVDQQRSTIPLRPGDTERADGKFSYHGALQLSGEAMLNIEENIAFENDNKISYQGKLTANPAIATMMVSFDVTLKRISYPYQSFRADDEEIRWPENFEKMLLINRRKTKELRIPTHHGEVIIRGDFELSAQDNRYNPQNDAREIRVGFRPDRGNISEAQQSFTIEFVPSALQTLDLTPVVNRGLADAVADDGKGGWTDQGPENDLSKLKPGRLTVQGIDFDIINPAANQGNACLVFDGAGRTTGVTQASVEANGQFDYLYLLHSTAWGTRQQGQEVATVQVEYQNGSTQNFPVICGRDVADWWRPLNLPNGIVGWVGENGSAYVGLFVSQFPLKNQPVKSVTFTGNGKLVWGIIAATLSSRTIDLKTENAVFITPGENWQPIKFERDIEKGSIMDSSALSDAPAGKYGFLRAVDGKLAFEKRRSQPVRFYGINLVRGSAMMTKEWSERLADRLVRTGYNLVRFQVYEDDIITDNPKVSTELDPEKVDRFGYFINCLKQRGIYITFDLYSGRRIRAGEIPEYPATPVPFMPLVFLYDSALNNWQTFARNIFNYKNPYTGLALKDDPILIGVSYMNEDDILAIYRPVENLYRAEFAKWLKENNAKGDAIANDPAGFNRFILYRYATTTAQMQKTFDEIGVKCLVSDQSVNNEILLTLLRNKYQFADIHAYYDHPVVFDAGNMSTLPSRCNNVSGLDNPAKMEAPALIFPLRIFGKPLVCTEWNFAMPNTFHAEGGALFGAYSALQDYDSIVRFCYSNGAQGVQEDTAGTGRTYFDLSMNPLMAMSEKMGIAMFLERHVAPSQLTFSFLISEKYADRVSKIETYPEAVRLLGFIGRTGSAVLDRNMKFTVPDHEVAAFSMDKNVIARYPATYPLPPEADPVRTLLAAGKLDPALADANAGRYRSSTGELEINRQNRTFRAVTPRSESFILDADKTLEGTIVSVRNHGTRAVVFVSAADGKTLPESRRIMLMHLTDCRYTMMKFNNAEMRQLDEYGKLPYLVRKGDVVLNLKGDYAGWRLYAVSTGGRRLGAVEFKTGPESAEIELKTFTRWGAVVAYELVKE